MLCLSRPLGTRIRIGGGDSGYPEVWITLVQLDRGKARLGIEAPKDVPVMREELLSPDEQYVAGVSR